MPTGTSSGPKSISSQSKLGGGAGAHHTATPVRGHGTPASPATPATPLSSVSKATSAKSSGSTGHTPQRGSNAASPFKPVIDSFGMHRCVVRCDVCCHVMCAVSVSAPFGSTVFCFVLFCFSLSFAITGIPTLHIYVYIYL